MPLIGGEWRFEIVRAKIALGEVDYERFALDLFVLDKERHLLVPISTKQDLYNPRLHLIIDRQDPKFKATGLSAVEDSFIIENEARPEKIVVIRKHRGWLEGALAERYALWSGRSGDPRLVRGHNPPRPIPSDFLPWRDEPELYKALTLKSTSIAPGHAEYDSFIGKVRVARALWPDWYWWVFARSQQAWEMDLSAVQKRRWMAACRDNQRGATELLNTWIGIRQRPVDIEDANQQARIVFAEACVLMFAHDEPEEIVRGLRKLTQELGEKIFLLR